MKILHISLWPIDEKSIGGTEKYVTCLSSALKEQSISNEVIMLSGKKNTINGVNYIPLKISPTKKLDEYSIKKLFFKEFNTNSLKKFAKKIEDLFDFSGYDVIHFNSLLFYFCAFNKKRVFTIHINQDGFDQNWGKNSFNIISKMIREDRTSETSFIVPSKHYSEIYKAKFKKNIVTIPHSLPKSFLKNRSNASKKTEDTLRIFVPSRLEIKQKGQDLLLESLNAVKDNLPKINVILAGIDDQYKPNVKILSDMARNFGIPLIFQKIKMADMKNVYNDVDLIILPSRYESFGYSALESLSLYKKTILSNIPTHKEIVSGNNFGFITKKNSPKELGKTILKAIKTEPNNQTNKKWENRYSYDKWVNKYVNFYKSCLIK